MRSRISPGILASLFLGGGGGGKHNVCNIFDLMSFVHVAFPINIPAGKPVVVRDGPFDIQGGGWDFSSRQVIFFSLFSQQVIFSKVNCNKFFF